MKTKPKKTVTAWAWGRSLNSGEYVGAKVCNLKCVAVSARLVDQRDGYACGPIVKITLPLPKESKR